MGQKQSSATEVRIDLEDRARYYTRIGAGGYGVVYRNIESGIITKRGKVEKMMFDPKGDVWREIRFMNFVESIEDVNMQRRFARIIDYQIMRSDFKFIPDLPDIEEYKQLREASVERNKWPYEYRLAMENKGRRLQLSDAIPLSIRYNVLRQMLEIVAFLQKHHKIHIDLHEGNVLVRDLENGVPQIALIDYGEVYFEEDKSKIYDDAVRDHLMIVQIVGTMVDLNQTFEYKDSMGKDHLSFSFAEKVEMIKANDPVFYQEVIERSSHHSLTPESDYMMSMFLDVLKTRNKTLFNKVMNFPEDTHVHVWYGYDDVVYIYDHITDLQSIIRHFGEKEKEKE